MMASRGSGVASPVRCGSSSVSTVSLKFLAVLTLIAMTFGVFLAPAALAQGEACSSCGPGPHWVDLCAGGQDQIANSGAVVGIDMDLDPLCTPDVNLIMWPCWSPNDLLVVNRSYPRDDSQNFPTLRPIDGHFDVIDTEIISMCLTGGGITLRAGAGQQQGPGVLAPSLGAVAEQTGDLRLADSFFDVFFEVYLPVPGVYLYNQVPLRLTATIDCAPPKARYLHPAGCIPLYTSPIPGQGMHVANLTSAQHNVNLKGVPSLTQWGIIALVLVLAGVGGIFILRRRVHSQP